MSYQEILNYSSAPFVLLAQLDSKARSEAAGKAHEVASSLLEQSAKIRFVFRPFATFPGRLHPKVLDSTFTARDSTSTALDSTSRDSIPHLYYSIQHTQDVDVWLAFHHLCDVHSYSLIRTFV